MVATSGSRYGPKLPLPDTGGWPKGFWLSPGGLSCCNQVCHFRGNRSIPKGQTIYLSGVAGMVYCSDHLPASSRPKLSPLKYRKLVTTEMVEAMNVVEQARPLVRQLLDAKSNEAWSIEELTVLDDLRQLMGIEP